MKPEDSPWALYSDSAPNTMRRVYRGRVIYARSCDRCWWLADAADQVFESETFDGAKRAAEECVDELEELSQ